MAWIGVRTSALHQPGHDGKERLEPARFQAPFVALDVLKTLFRQAELPFLEFPTNKDETLFLGFAQSLQARTFGGRLPIQANGAVQQYHYLDNLVSPLLMLKRALIASRLRSRNDHQ